jgi:predicted transcriptional regulator
MAEVSTGEPSRDECEECLAAIREGLADVEAGRTTSARVALATLARKYGIEIDSILIS